MAARESESDREITVERTFDAPRELVWRAWTDPKHVARWWGPNGFTLTNHKMEVKPGGMWRSVMHGPDGRDYPNTVIYREVVEPERLTYDHPAGDGEDAQFHAIVTFVEVKGKTTVTMRMIFESAAELRRIDKKYGAIEGAQQHSDRMVRHVGRMLHIVAPPGERNVIFTRWFDAPRRLVFEAMTKPEHVVRWFGPHYMTIVSCESDLRVGGKWRIVHRSPDGQEFAFRGVTRELVPPERWVQTFVFEGMPDAEAVTTFVLEDHGNRTKLIETMVHDSVESRDQHIKNGMEDGASESLERLDDLLATLG